MNTDIMVFEICHERDIVDDDFPRILSVHEKCVDFLFRVREKYVAWAMNELQKIWNIWKSRYIEKSHDRIVRADIPHF